MRVPGPRPQTQGPSRPSPVRLSFVCLFVPFNVLCHKPRPEEGPGLLSPAGCSQQIHPTRRGGGSLGSNAIWPAARLLPARASEVGAVLGAEPIAASACCVQSPTQGPHTSPPCTDAHHWKPRAQGFTRRPERTCGVQPEVHVHRRMRLTGCKSALRGKPGKGKQRMILHGSSQIKTERAQVPAAGSPAGHLHPLFWGQWQPGLVCDHPVSHAAPGSSGHSLVAPHPHSHLLEAWCPQHLPESGTGRV